MVVKYYICVFSCLNRLIELPAYVSTLFAVRLEFAVVAAKYWWCIRWTLLTNRNTGYLIHCTQCWNCSSFYKSTGSLLFLATIPKYFIQGELYTETPESMGEYKVIVSNAVMIRGHTAVESRFWELRTTERALASSKKYGMRRVDESRARNTECFLTFSGFFTIILNKNIITQRFEFQTNNIDVWKWSLTMLVSRRPYSLLFSTCTLYTCIGL